MNHFRKKHKEYKSYPAPVDCHFCDPHKYSTQVFEETEHCFVIPNRTFYDVWEMRRVQDHRMVVPKRHVLSLSELTSEERDDIMKVMGKYEQQGYNIYARAPDNASRSVPHQHTHIIKISNKYPRGAFMWRKPYILWLFR